MQKMIWITGVLLLMQSCVKETSFSIDGPAPFKVCAEAILTDEPGQQTIALTLPVNQLNQSPAPVTGAILLISNADSTWALTEQPVGSGRYLTPAAFYARPLKTYTLLIALNGHIYSAKATMLPGTTFPELKYSKNNDDNLYHIDWVANAFSAENAAMWEILIDWSLVAGYTHLDSINTHARLLFYTLPTLDVSEIFAPQMEAVNFPVGTQITERRYSVTPEHAAFLRELLLETNWAGGIFNEAAANVTTNFSAGACGFFGICSVTSLSVIVSP